MERRLKNVIFLCHRGIASREGEVEGFGGGEEGMEAYESSNIVRQVQSFMPSSEIYKTFFNGVDTSVLN